MPSDIQQFFRQHPVFTYGGFRASMAQMGHTNQYTLNNLLAHYLKQGRIIRIKRGLYASIPVGAESNHYPISPYLIAGYLTQDAVIAYHSALAFHGTTYSVSQQFVYATTEKPKPLQFRDNVYQPTAFPVALIKQNKTHLAVDTEDVQGMPVWVSSRERTLVDVLDRPALSGSWEEIWRSLDMIEWVNMDRLIDYALTLNTATTIAKVGFYLEQRQHELGLSNHKLDQLQQYGPASVHYMDPKQRRNGTYVRRWQLMVPPELISRGWEEELNWEPDQ